MDQNVAARIAKRFILLPLEKRQAYLEKMLAEGVSPANLPIPQVRDEFASLPLSFAQERQWFLWQLDPTSAAYHMSAALRLRGALDIDALQRSFDRLVEHMRLYSPEWAAGVCDVPAATMRRASMLAPSESAIRRSSEIWRSWSRSRYPMPPCWMPSVRLPVPGCERSCCLTCTGRRSRPRRTACPPERWQPTKKVSLCGWSSTATTLH